MKYKLRRPSTSLRAIAVGLSLMTVSSFALSSSGEVPASSSCFPLTNIAIEGGLNPADLKTTATIGDFQIRMEEGEIDSIFDKNIGKDYPLEVGGKVESIQRFSERNIILVNSGAASNAFLSVIDLDKHKEIWSVETFEHKWIGEKLETDPYCDCSDAAETECHCYAGGVFEFDNECRPHELKRESTLKTKAVLGVAFKTDAWVYKPKTSVAKLIPAPVQNQSRH